MRRESVYLYLLAISEIAISENSRLLLASVAEQAGLSLTWSQIPEDKYSCNVAHNIELFDFLMSLLNALCCVSLVIVSFANNKSLWDFFVCATCEQQIHRPSAPLMFISAA